MFYDNIPLISYILLKGRCRTCGEQISWKYPFVELLTGLFFFGIYATYRLDILSFIYAVFFASLIVISMIDLEHKIIPDVITIPGMIAGLICSIFFLPLGFVHSLAALLLGGGLFYAIAVISKGGMGGGDIKLIAAIGSFLGWQKTLLTIFLSALIGSIVGISLMIVKKKGRKDMIPYGPFIALGAAISVFWGKDIIIWYLSLTSGPDW